MRRNDSAAPAVPRRPWPAGQAPGGRLPGAKPLNYRHAFHAGNFADLVKHAVWLHLLAALQAQGPVRVVDTHGGAGLYDLGDAAARRAGEAEAGIDRLLAAETPPPPLAELREVVRGLRAAHGGAALYPGSPWLTATRLRPGDALTACELRPDDHAHLQQVLREAGGPAEARLGDGFAAAAELAADGDRRRLAVLIDPPFERGDDYARAAKACAAVLRPRPDAAVLVWLPLKDLETLDGFARRVEALCPAPGVLLECRLRPLLDPMRLNGCALLLLNAPAEVAAEGEAVCAWVATASGEGRGVARATPLRGG